ncbi:MAG: serine/threonine-protein phosphatase [Deltaproteobacteria bacterium]|nr:serine/threonine-protein phosphatase [Deltaproteobacteria bacterium]
MLSSQPTLAKIPNINLLQDCLLIAQEIQQNLLPKKPPIISGLDISGASVYSCMLGGDFFDYMDFEEVCCRTPDHVGIVVGDVSGHGIYAALLMSTVRAYIRCRATQPGDIGQILNSVNGMICKDTGVGGHFITVFYLDVNPGKKEIRWVRAGHEASLLFDAESSVFHELKGEGSVLGVTADTGYAQQSLDGLKTGDIILIGTDGAWEARNPDGEMFGKARIKSIVQQNADRSASDILREIFAALTAFQQSSIPADDVTLVVVKFAE